MRTIALLALLVLVSFATKPKTSDKDIIQQTLNGIYEQNKLEDPTTIVQCIDDDSAHKIVEFMGKMFEKAASGTVEDLIEMIKLVKEFCESINPEVAECLDDNEELQDLAQAYNLTEADPIAVQKKILEYVTTHYNLVHRWMIDLNANWKAEKYYQTGFHAAVYAHTVLDTKSRTTFVKSRETKPAEKAHPKPEPVARNKATARVQTGPRTQPNTKIQPKTDNPPLIDYYMQYLSKGMDTILAFIKKNRK